MSRHKNQVSVSPMCVRCSQSHTVITYILFQLNVRQAHLYMTSKFPSLMYMSQHPSNAFIITIFILMIFGKSMNNFKDYHQT